MKNLPIREWTKNLIAKGGVLVFFIMAFEVMIMISPFAFFFYSVFNPIFHWLDACSATRWLTHFFLPHMVLPPTVTLKFIRILGSILFVIGSLTFIVCALQVYLGKIFKWGIADKGLYRFIRHPQYLALGIWGIGTVILWPRFIVLVTLSVIFIVYYFLAKDEEKRMVSQYADSYINYMNTTGMFLPRSVEMFFVFPFRCIRPIPLRKSILAISVLAVVISTGFILRYITLKSFHFKSRENISLLPIMPEDAGRSDKALDYIISASGKAGAIEFLKKENNYLGYLMPVDYTMQGMIADTGEEHQLHKKHHTVGLIVDWVFHPFEHLRRPPAVLMAKIHNVDPVTARRHHCPLGIDNPNLQCDVCPYRRVIIVEVSNGSNNRLVGKNLLNFNTSRIPVGFIDINTEIGEIVNVKKVQPKTAWKDVPTPAI